MSAPGQGGGDGAAPQGEGQGQAPQGQDAQAALAEQLSALSTGQEELRNWLQSEPWAQQQEQPEAQAEPELDLSWLDPAQVDYDPQQMAERLSGYVEQAADQRVQALMKDHIAPLQQQVQEQRIEQAARDLASEFPELENEETATEVVNASRVLAEQFGQPELAGQPQFWRLVFMAGKAAESANAEGESPNAAHLESGSGATPAGPQAQQADLAQIFGVQPNRDPVPWR